MNSTRIRRNFSAQKKNSGKFWHLSRPCIVALAIPPQANVLDDKLIIIISRYRERICTKHQAEAEGVDAGKEGEEEEEDNNEQEEEPCGARRLLLSLSLFLSLSLSLCLSLCLSLFLFLFLFLVNPFLSLFLFSPLPCFSSSHNSSFDKCHVPLVTDLVNMVVEKYKSTSRIGSGNLPDPQWLDENLYISSTKFCGFGEGLLVQNMRTCDHDCLLLTHGQRYFCEPG